MTDPTRTLRERYRNRRLHNVPTPLLDVPTTGDIPAEMVTVIQNLAYAAKSGDIAARDELYACLEARFHCIGNILHPWPNTPAMIGIWDRDDVHQESWIIFVELLEAWEDDVPFVNYLFARFSWRLRDRILRGIGKPLPPIGSVRVPEVLLAVTAYARDEEEPESALMASKLFEALIEQMLGEDAASASDGEILRSLHSPRRKTTRDTMIANARGEAGKRRRSA